MDSIFCACLLLIIGTLSSIDSQPTLPKKKAHFSLDGCTSSDECEVNTDCLYHATFRQNYCLCASDTGRQTYEIQHCARVRGAHVPVTQGYGEPCLDLECIYNLDCDWSNRVDPKCICGPPRPIWVSGTTTCLGRPHGEQCDNKRNSSGLIYNDCMDPLTCNPDPGNATRFICGCPYATPIWNSTAMELSMVCHGKYHDEDCQNTAECHQGLGCAAGKCACEDPNKSNWNDEKKLCEGKYNGEACTGDAECLTDVLLCSDGTDKTCECPHTSPTWNPTAKNCGQVTPFGGHCDTVSECAPPGETCDENDKCACLKNRTLDEDRKRCASPSVTFGGPCKKQSECMQEQGLQCIDNICKCTRGQIWAFGNCQALSDLTKCEPNEIPNVCDTDVGQNLECDGTSKVCNCPPNKEYSLHARACKLKGGEKCSVNGVEEHDLCASQQCVKEAGKAEATCACPDVNGKKMIWSVDAQEKKCIQNLYDVKCLPSNGNADCHHEGYVVKSSPEFQTLICIDGRCKCEDMYTYIRGYCVFAFRIDNQTCDSSGTITNPTCGVATHNSTASLTCRNGKCACLPKEVITATNPIQKEYTTLTWDNNKTVCNLKPNGAACKKGAECFGRECSSGKCATRRTRSGGSRVVGLLTNFVFIGPILAIFNY